MITLFEHNWGYTNPWLRQAHEKARGSTGHLARQTVGQVSVAPAWPPPPKNTTSLLLFGKQAMKKKVMKRFKIQVTRERALFTHSLQHTQTALGFHHLPGPKLKH